MDGTAGLLVRDPQPAPSSLSEAARKVFPIVVCGNHFPLSPVTRNYVKESLRADGILTDPRIRPLAIVDLDDLEALACLAKAGHLLPRVLDDWLSHPYAKGSFAVYMWATYGGAKLHRPPATAASLQEAFGAMRELLTIADEPQGADPG